MKVEVLAGADWRPTEDMPGSPAASPAYAVLAKSQARARPAAP